MFNEIVQFDIKSTLTTGGRQNKTNAKNEEIKVIVQLTVFTFRDT